jgi:catechol 2,3-dioxygenase
MEPWHEVGPAPEPWQPPASGRYGRLGITRGNYVAVCAPNPEQAAEFAVKHMGFHLVHVDDDNRHYLAGHGLDPYSLVYTEGDGPVDHISYAVDDVAALATAEATLTEAGTEFERIDQSPLWRHRQAVRFRAPTGATIELTPGVAVDIPMAELMPQPPTVPAPIAFDHAILRTTDINAMIEWAPQVLGLRESGRIIAPDGIPILAFFRCATLFHCFGLARSEYDGMHHYEFTLKNDRALFAAFETLSADPEVEIIWAPVRHGCGQNIAFYFRDAIGNIVEFSAEEELILGEETYEVQHWSVLNGRSTDEWGSHPPQAMM